MTTIQDDSDFGLGPFVNEIDALASVPERPAAPPPPPPPPPFEFPAGWLLDNVRGPVAYRLLAELLPQPAPPTAPSMAYGSPEALALVLAQQLDGTWGDSMLAPAQTNAQGRVTHVGMVAAVLRLCELGWEREAPPMVAARRPLFRLLAEDVDPRLTYEFAADGKEGEVVARSRAIVRESAAAALARSAHDADPRLRGAAHRILERINDFLSSPLAESPWEKVAGKHVLAADAKIPTLFHLMMLAFMPQFRLERQEHVDRLLGWCTRPLTKHENLQTVGGRQLPVPGAILGDPLGARGAVDSDIPFALLWLELWARMGQLRKQEGWNRVFDRFLEERDRNFVWRPRNSQRVVTENPLVWPFAQLPGAANVEVTFRLALIAKHAGRTIEFV